MSWIHIVGGSGVRSTNKSSKVDPQAADWWGYPGFAIGSSVGQRSAMRQEWDVHHRYSCSRVDPGCSAWTTPMSSSASVVQPTVG
jgi:hypothetical protein